MVPNPDKITSPRERIGKTKRTTGTKGKQEKIVRRMNLKTIWLQPKKVVRRVKIRVPSQAVKQTFMPWH